jgi:hypothetical protein
VNKAVLGDYGVLLTSISRPGGVGCISLSEEVQQVGVEPVLVRVGQTVGSAFIDLQGSGLEELRQIIRGDDRHDLVVVAVDDQCRNVELLQILG